MALLKSPKSISRGVFAFSVGLLTSVTAQSSTAPISIFPDPAGYTVVIPVSQEIVAPEEGPLPGNVDLVLSAESALPTVIYKCSKSNTKNAGEDTKTQPKPNDCFTEAIVLPDKNSVAISWISESHTGAHTIELRQNDAEIGRVAVNLSRLSWASTVCYAAVSTIFLLCVVMLLLKRSPARTMPDKKIRTMLSMLVIDPDSNTYSLSKAQLYLWLFASLFGYAYLFYSRVFVQGNMSIPDAQLPTGAQASLVTAGALSLSLGTTVVSAAVKSMIGGKGSGDFNPSWSDLITSGGVVAPERVQLLVWTLVAVTSYVAITIGVSPIDIQTLPAVPSGLLALTGISAAGYVGGQIARGPGPQIKDLSAKILTTVVDNGSLLIELNGSAIATKGSSFFVTNISDTGKVGEDISIKQAFGVGSVIDSTSGIATQLTMTVPQPPGVEWSSAQKYRLTIVNPDGEHASWEFKPI